MDSVKCPLCPPQIVSKNGFSELGVHIVVKHGTSIVDFYVCPCCPEAYKGEEALQAHLFYEHNKYDKPYKMMKKWLSMACADCGVSFRIDGGGKLEVERKEEWTALAKFMTVHSPDRLIPYHVHAVDSLHEVPQLRQRLTQIAIDRENNNRCPYCHVPYRGRLEMKKHMLRGCPNRQPSARLSLAFREEDNSKALEMNSKMRKVIKKEDLQRLEHKQARVPIPIHLHGAPSNAKITRCMDFDEEFAEDFAVMEKRLKFDTLAPLPASHTQHPSVPYTPNGLRSIFFCCMRCRVIVAGAMRAAAHSCADGERPQLKPLFFPRPSAPNARISCPVCDEHTSCSIFGLQTHLTLDHDVDFRIDEQMENVDETGSWPAEDAAARHSISMNQLNIRQQYFASPKSTYLPKESFFRLCRICMSVMPPDDKYYGNHLKKHEAKQIKVHSCFECSMFTDPKTIDDHQRNHFKMQYRCIPCKVAFRDDTRYYMHLSTVHKLDLVHFCKRCNLATKSVTRLRAHIYAKTCQHDNLPHETYRYPSPGIITECLFSFEGGLVPGCELQLPSGYPRDRHLCSSSDCASRSLIVPDSVTDPTERSAQFLRVSCPNDLFPLPFSEYKEHDTEQFSKSFKVAKSNLEDMKKESELLQVIQSVEENRVHGIWNLVSCFFYDVKLPPAPVSTPSASTTSAASEAPRASSAAENGIKDSPCTSTQAASGSAGPSLKRSGSPVSVPTPAKQRKVEDENQEELKRWQNVARTVCAKKYRLCMENFCKFGDKFDYKPWQLRATMLEIGPADAVQNKCLFCQSLRANFGIPPESVEEWIDSFTKSSSTLAVTGEVYKKLFEKNHRRRICARHFDISEIDLDDSLDGTKNPLPKFMARKCLVCTDDIIAGLEIPILYKEQVKVLAFVPGCKLSLKEMMDACEKEVHYTCHLDALIASDHCPNSLPPNIYKTVHTPSLTERMHSRGVFRSTSPSPSDEDSLLQVLAEARRDAAMEPPTPAAPPPRQDTPPEEFPMPATPATLRRILETPVSAMDVMPATPMHREKVNEIVNGFRSFENGPNTSNGESSARPTTSSQPQHSAPTFAVPTMPPPHRVQQKKTAHTSTTQSTPQQQQQQQQQQQKASSSTPPSGHLWHLLQQQFAPTSTSQPSQNPPVTSPPTSRAPPPPEQHQQQQPTLFSVLGPPGPSRTIAQQANPQIRVVVSQSNQQQQQISPGMQQQQQQQPGPPFVQQFPTPQQIQQQQQRMQAETMRQLQQQQFVQLIGNQQQQRGIVPQQQLPQQPNGLMNIQQHRIMQERQQLQMQQQQQQLFHQQMLHQQQIQQMQQMAQRNIPPQAMQQMPHNGFAPPPAMQQRPMQPPPQMQQPHFVFQQQQPPQFMISPQQAELAAAAQRQRVMQQSAQEMQQQPQHQPQPGPSTEQQSSMRAPVQSNPLIPPQHHAAHASHQTPPSCAANIMQHQQKQQQQQQPVAQASRPSPSSCDANGIQRPPSNTPVSGEITLAEMRDILVDTRQRLHPTLAIDQYREFVDSLNEGDLKSHYNVVQMMQSGQAGPSNVRPLQSVKSEKS